jgi:hypothetical protein
MPTLQPPKLVTEKNSFTNWLNYFVRWATSERVKIVGEGWTLKESADGKTYIAPAGGKAARQWQGEYDPARTYNAGDTFKVSRTLVVDSKTVPKGLWGVTPAGTDVVGNVWTGTVPANPTGAAVPQTTWVSGAGAELIVADCS